MHWNFSRFSRAVIVAVLPACCVIAPSVAGQDAGLELAQSAAESAPKLFHGAGVVTCVNAKSGVIAIKHEAIQGLMDAMEMEYQVKPAKLAESLAVGEKVEFTVDGKTLAIVHVARRAATK